MSIPELTRRKGQGASFGIAHHSIYIISNCTIGDKENVMKTSYNPHSLRGGQSIHSLQYIPGISLNSLHNNYIGQTTISIQTNNRPTRNPLKTKGELLFSRRVSSYYFTRGSRRVILVTHPVHGHITMPRFYLWQ